MKALLFAIVTIAGSIVPASAITVTAPSAGASLTSPFNLVASTTTCASVAAVSMGYSIDSGSANIEPTSFSAQVVASPGAHVLHVKCWGKQTNDQVLMNITILAAPASTATITVNSPANGATLT